MPLCRISELPPCKLSLDVAAARQNSGKIGFRLPPQKSQLLDAMRSAHTGKLCVERAELQREKEAKYTGLRHGQEIQRSHPRAEDADVNHQTGTNKSLQEDGIPGKTRIEKEGFFPCFHSIKK